MPRSRFALLVVAALAAVGLTHAQAPSPAKGDGKANRNARFGLPGEAKADPANKEAFLIDRPQYVMSYNDKRKTANWVSWHLVKADMGKVARGSFEEDPDLPKGFQRVQFNTYTGSGFDRGHLCPSKDRSDTEANNDAVFLMTNIIPQAPNCNQTGWERLEYYCRGLALDGKELHIVTGPHGIGGVGLDDARKLTIGRNPPFVTVPAHVWKVILVLDRGGQVTKNARTIAVWMPNDQTVDDEWPKYRVPVAEVEKKTGLTFFPLIPDDIAAAIKEKADTVKVVVPPRNK